MSSIASISNQVGNCNYWCYFYCVISHLSFEYLSLLNESLVKQHNNTVIMLEVITSACYLNFSYGFLRCLFWYLEKTFWVYLYFIIAFHQACWSQTSKANPIQYFKKHLSYLSHSSQRNKNVKYLSRLFNNLWLHIIIYFITYLYVGYFISTSM